jgi:hypothetical protein
VNEGGLSGFSRLVWRSMTWPLEARRPGLAAQSRLGGASSLIDSWLEATAWWTEALVEGPIRGSLPNTAPLREIAQGVAAAFQGHRLGGEVSGRRFSADLDSLWLGRRADRCVGRLDLRSVSWDGLVAEELSVVADAAALTPPPTATLTLSGIEIQGRSALEPFVAWLDRRVTTCDLRVAEGGFIEAIPRNGSPTVVLDAVVEDGKLELELRALRWRRLILRCPRWLRLARTISIPPLPDGVRVARARRRGTDVEFRLSLPTFTYSFDHLRLREAIYRACQPHMRARGSLMSR